MAVPAENTGLGARIGLAGVARRTLAICLLLVTVFLWTLSNFLASVSEPRPAGGRGADAAQSILSDHTYDKPFLVYVNSSVFAVSLAPTFVQHVLRSGVRGLRRDVVRLWRRRGQAGPRPELPGDGDGDESSGERLLGDDGSLDEAPGTAEPPRLASVRRRC